MNYYEKIDSVLNFIKQLDAQGAAQNVIFETFCNEGILDSADVLTTTEAITLVEKLERDNLILKLYDDIPNEDNPTSTDKNPGYIITFEGLLFEGYVKHESNEKLKRILLKVEKWLVVVGTLGAGLYGFYEILK